MILHCCADASSDELDEATDWTSSATLGFLGARRHCELLVGYSDSCECTSLCGKV
jgi:hypothetical protein